MVGSRERSAERLDGALVLFAVGREVGEIVVEGAMDHALRPGRTTTQAVRIFEIAAMHLGACRRQCLCAGIRPRQSEHLMPGAEKLRDDGRADETGGASNEYAHGTTLCRGWMGRYYLRHQSADEAVTSYGYEH